MEIGHVTIGNDHDTLLNKVLVTDGLYETFVNDFFRDYEEHVRYSVEYNQALASAVGALKQVNKLRRLRADRLSAREVEDVIALNAPFGDWYGLKYRYYRMLTNRHQGQPTQVFAQERDVVEHAANLPDILIFLYGRLFEQQLLWSDLMDSSKLANFVNEAACRGNIVTVSGNIDNPEAVERKVECLSGNVYKYIRTNLVIERSVYSHLKLSSFWPDFVSATQTDILIVDN